eukprot:6864246-Pyramimonas_sp.AAC.1
MARRALASAGREHVLRSSGTQVNLHAFMRQPRPTRIIRTHDEDARALEGRVDTLRAGRGQRAWARMGRGGKAAKFREPIGT